MKNFVLKLSGLGLVLVALFFASCVEDEIPTFPLGPIITLETGMDLVSADSEVIIGESFTVRTALATGDAQLRTLTITDGSGAILPTDRFTVDGGATTSQNPLLIIGANADGVTYDITITPAAGQMVDDKTSYTFEVEDVDGETDSREIEITTAALPGTPLEMSIEGVLLNQAGPTGTGGLDLDTGVGTGSGNADAEIRDLGIDCTVSPDDETWRAQFGTVNGAAMVKIDRTQLENFDFENVTLKETIADLFTGAAAVELMDGVSQAPSCDETPVTDVTGQVTEDDVYVVFANDTYYLIRVDEINFVSDDPGTTGNENNDDNYVFSIKY